MPKIVVVGSSNIDMVVLVDHLPRLGETVLGGNCLTVAGGKGANQAVAVAKAGGEVLFFGRIGTDSFGDECLRSMSREGVDVSRVLRDSEHPSCIALIMVDPAGHNQIAVAPGANAHLSARDVDSIADVMSAAQILLVQLEIPLETVHRAVAHAKKNGLTVILNPAPARPLPHELLRMVDIITPNESEARILTGRDVSHIESGSRAARQLLEQGVQNVVLTLGAEGALLVTMEGSKKIAGRRVRALDSTAAGDVFAGCLATALSEGRTLEEAIGFANAAAAICVTRVGAQVSIPTRREIDEFMAAPRRYEERDEDEAVTRERIEELQARAMRIRRQVLEMVYGAGTGSLGGSLSCVDVLTALYFHAMVFNAREPRWPHRDRLVFSKGHCAPALYAVLAEAGIIEAGLLARYAKLDSPIQGIPDSRRTPGVDATCASPGQGLSIANGMALAAKMSGADYRIYALLGDGELEEGQIWEAAMTAASQKLDNLIVLLDYNGVLSEQENDETRGMDSLVAKWESFGWNARQADGHDFVSLIEALGAARESGGKPAIVIAHTIRARGVSFLERKPDGLGAILSPNEFDMALEELAG